MRADSLSTTGSTYAYVVLVWTCELGACVSHYVSLETIAEHYRCLLPCSIESNKGG